MPRTLEIVMKGRNDIGPAIQSAQADMKKLRDTADKFGTALNIGASIGLAKGALAGLAGLIEASRGDTEAIWAAFSRLPFGIGETVSVARSLWNAMTGARQEAERINKLAVQKKEGDDSKKVQGDLRLDIESDTLSASDRAHRRYQQVIDTSDAEFQKQMKGASFQEMSEALNRQASIERANKARLERDLTKIENEEREKGRKELIERLDRDHRLEVEDFEKRVREKHDIAKRENGEQLALLRDRVERESQEQREGYTDWIASMRPPDTGRGSLGTISTADVTGRFLGLGADAQAEANKRHTEQMRVAKETNEKLDMMLQINERNGGALEQFFGTFSGL